MRALLTGGSGFIGTRLAAALARDGYEVTILDVLHPQIHPDGIGPPPPPGGRFVHGDATDAETMAAVVDERPDLIVHLAAETSVGQSLDQASRHALANVLGTTRLLDALSQTGHRPAQIVLPSSRAVYGEGDWTDAGGTATATAWAGPRRPEDLDAGRWLPAGVPDGAEPLPSRADRTPARPTSVYAATKLAQEQLLLSWCGANAVPLTVVRIQNAYGAGQSPTNSYTGIMMLFARLALAGDPVTVYEGGGILRDFVHIDDIVRALTLAASLPPPTSRIVDIGSGVPVTLLEMANMVTAATGAPPAVTSGAYRLGDIRAAYCDPSLAEAELGWRPTVSLADGIDELLAWLAARVAR